MTQENRRWCTTDDIRSVAVLDDATKATIASVFAAREHNNCITMDQLMELMSEIQVACDPDTMGTMVLEDEWDNLTLNMCYVIIGRFVEIAQRQQAEQQKQTEASVLNTETTATVMYLTTVDYLLHVFKLKGENGVEYRWQRPELDIRPKSILMLSVAAMVLIGAVFLVVLIIGLNEQATKNQISTFLNEFDSQIGIATTSLFIGGVENQVANLLMESSSGIASLLNSFVSLRQQTIGEQLEFSARTLSAALNVEGGLFAADRQIDIQNRLYALQVIFQSQGSSSDVTSILDSWMDAKSDVKYIVLNQSQVLFSRDCSNPSSLLTSPTVLSGYSANSSGTSTFCGGIANWACGPLLLFNYSACVWEARSTVQSETNDYLHEAVTAMNRASPGNSVELGLAFDNSGFWTSLGNGKKLPMQCVRIGLCKPPVEVFSAANASANSGYQDVFGYDGGYWLSGYTKFLLRNTTYAVGVLQDTSEVKSSFQSALVDQQWVRDSNKLPRLVLVRPDQLENVQLLPVNVTLATWDQQQTMGHALNNRTGVTYADFSNPDAIMTGYAPAAIAGMAVGFEVPSPALSQMVTATMIEVFREQNRELPSSKEILLYQGGSPVPTLLVQKTTCTRRCVPHPAATAAFASKSSGKMSTTDHVNRDVECRYRYVPTSPPLVVIVQMTQNEIQTSLLERRYVAIGVGCGILVAVQFTILILTRRVLDRIEDDYNRYKTHIEEEKHQFSELVKDVMPPYIAEKIMKGTRLVAETYQQLTFFFSDMVGAHDIIKTATAKHLVRVFGYTFMVEDEIAAFYGVHKIKTIGDTYFAVAGLDDYAGGGARTGKEHQVYRMASFACVCQQLFGPAYAHFPERTECFKIAAGGQDFGAMKMVRLRMGIHTGSAVAGVVDVGRAPHFDCFGPSVNLASRMESTSTTGRVQISGPTMDILSKMDKEGLFEFESPRKTLVKGYGTMVTYLIKSTNLHVPEVLVSKLHIDRANRRQFFAESALPTKLGSERSSHNQSAHNNSQQVKTGSVEGIGQKAQSLSGSQRHTKGHSKETAAADKTQAPRTGGNAQAGSTQPPKPSTAAEIELPNFDAFNVPLSPPPPPDF